MSGQSRVLVIGGGIAGTAAAYTLRQLGVSVKLVESGPGATDYFCGAFDVQPWNGPTENKRANLTELNDFCDALGMFSSLRAEQASSLVCSGAGVLRPCVRSAHGILDIGQLEGRRVGICDVGRSDFQALHIAHALSASSFAAQTKTSFSVVHCDNVFHPEHTHYPLAHFCRLLDEPNIADRFVSWVNQSAKTDCDALLLGPWLGTGEPSQITQRCSIFVGECLHPPESTMGQRYRLHRDRLLGHCAVDRETASVLAVAVDVETGRVNVEFAEQPHAIFDGVVIATGGVVGGGIRFFETRRGGHVGWTKQAWPPIGEGPAAGELAGWDPSVQPHTWLHGVSLRESLSPRIQLAESQQLVGPDTMGRAASRGIFAATLLADVLLA